MSQFFQLSGPWKILQDWHPIVSILQHLLSIFFTFLFLFFFEAFRVVYFTYAYDTEANMSMSLLFTLSSSFLKPPLFESHVSKLHHPTFFLFNSLLILLDFSSWLTVSLSYIHIDYCSSNCLWHYIPTLRKNKTRIIN